MKRWLPLLVALATIPSVFALAPGEFPIAPLPIGFAPHDRQNVEVATSDTLAFTAWEDSRVDPSQPRVWGQRVKRDTGQILDPTGISIARLTNSPRSRLLAVGTDGNDFLVAWTDGDRMKLAKVTAAGVVVPLLDPNPNISVEQASITWIGDSYAIVFTDPSTPQFLPATISVFLLNADGSIRVPPLVAVRSLGVRAFAAGATADGLDLFIVWSDVADGTVHAVPVPTFQIRGGSLTAAPPLAQTFAEPPPVKVAMATNGTEIFAAWLESSNVYRVRRFGNNGAPLDPAATVATAPDEPPVGPAVAWDGSQYIVVFKAGDNSLQAVRYDASANRTDVTPLGIAPAVIDDVSAAAPVSFPDTSFVAWISHQPVNPQQPVAPQGFGGFLSQGGAFRFPLADFTLSSSFADRNGATAVWVGDHYLAAWRDATNFSRAVIGRFTVEGQPLDGTGVIVSTGDAAAAPALASNGRTAIVAWLEGNGVAVAFVGENGAAFQLRQGLPGGLPAVSWNGQQYLIAWRSTQGELLALRATGGGTLIDQQPVSIAPITGQPIIGWTGNSYVVAFRDPEGCFPFCDPSTLWAQMVSPALTAIGSRIRLSETFAGLPVIAEGPAGALVVWPRTAGTTTTLRGARVVNGAILDPLNGFEIGAAAYASVHTNAVGWGVVSGPIRWNVSPNGTVTPLATSFAFVPAGARSAVVLGGPEPLVVYRREPVGSEQMMQTVARFFISASTTRHRAVRH